jgi:hypothetical protein
VRKDDHYGKVLETAAGDLSGKLADRAPPTAAAQTARPGAAISA